MRYFDYGVMPQGLLTPGIMKLVSSIHEYKGKLDVYKQLGKPALFSSMHNLARTQGALSSVRIADIENADETIAYANAYDFAYQHNPGESPSASDALALHALVCKNAPQLLPGKFKNAENTIVNKDADGQILLRFSPLSAFETPMAVHSLMTAYFDAIDQNQYDPLLITPMFILDFLCIHPFNGANGRVSRLLTYLALRGAGYAIGDYASLDRLIEETGDAYFDAIQRSTYHWHEGQNSYYPFVQFMLQIIERAYAEVVDKLSQEIKAVQA